MERIEALIEQLKKQFAQNESPAQLLGTVQLLQFELTKLNTGGQSSLGTAKVAVVLPSKPSVVNLDIPAQNPELEKYTPKPAAQAQPATKEVKETLLVGDDSVSLVQKNGQLDMVFDPLKDIPTLSSQVLGREINDLVNVNEESLNEKLRQGKTEIVEVLKETPIKDLRKAIGINERFLYINELFRGDENMYERCIKTINNFNIYAEAEYWINRELKVKLGWINDNETVKQFDQLVKRRFS